MSWCAPAVVLPLLLLLALPPSSCSAAAAGTPAEDGARGGSPGVDRACWAHVDAAKGRCARAFGVEDADEAVDALRGRHVVFVGDSHARFSAVFLAKVLLSSRAARCERKAGNALVPEQAVEPKNWRLDFTYGPASHRDMLQDRPRMISAMNYPIEYFGALPAGIRLTFLRRVMVGSVLDAVGELLECDHAAGCTRLRAMDADMHALVVSPVDWHMLYVHNETSYGASVDALAALARSVLLPHAARERLERSTRWPLALWMDPPVPDPTKFRMNPKDPPFHAYKLRYFTDRALRSYSRVRKRLGLTVRDDASRGVFVPFDLDEVARANGCRGGPGACTAPDGSHLPDEHYAHAALALAGAVRAYWGPVPAAAPPSAAPLTGPAFPCR